MRCVPLALLVLACATPAPVAHDDAPGRPSPRFMICRGDDKLVRIDNRAWRAQLFDSDQPVGSGSCSTVAVAGADTRCLGSEFSFLYDSRDVRLGQLVEPTGVTMMTCREVTPPPGAVEP